MSFPLSCKEKLDTAKPKAKRTKRIAKTSSQKISGLLKNIPLIIPKSVDIELLRVNWQQSVDDLIKQTRKNNKEESCSCKDLSMQAKKELKKNFNEEKLRVDSVNKLISCKSLHIWSDWATNITKGDNHKLTSLLTRTIISDGLTIVTKKG